MAQADGVGIFPISTCVARGPVTVAIQYDFPSFYSLRRDGKKYVGCTRAKRSVARKQFCMYLRAMRYDQKAFWFVRLSNELYMYSTDRNYAAEVINTAALGSDNVQRIRVAARANPHIRETGLS